MSGTTDRSHAKLGYEVEFAKCLVTFPDHLSVQERARAIREAKIRPAIYFGRNDTDDGVLVASAAAARDSKALTSATAAASPAAASSSSSVDSKATPEQLEWKGRRECARNITRNRATALPHTSVVEAGLLRRIEAEFPSPDYTRMVASAQKLVAFDRDLLVNSLLREISVRMVQMHNKQEKTITLLFVLVVSLDPCYGLSLPPERLELDILGMSAAAPSAQDALLKKMLKKYSRVLLV